MKTDDELDGIFGYDDFEDSNSNYQTNECNCGKNDWGWCFVVIAILCVLRPDIIVWLKIAFWGVIAIAIIWFILWLAKQFLKALAEPIIEAFNESAVWRCIIFSCAVSAFLVMIAYLDKTN